MCNLYTPASTADSITQIFLAEDRTGNEPWPHYVYPDRDAPIIRNGENGPEIVQSRWGMPSPKSALRGRLYDRGVINIRNLKSPHWQRWLGHEHRCLVPFERFSEPIKGGNQWFATNKSVAFFAGIEVRGWSSVRQSQDGETTDDLFAFLTCDSNELVASIHSKAMPVILTRTPDLKAWLGGAPAVEMQVSFPAASMKLA